MGKIKNEMEYLKSGDLKKVAFELGISYNKVRDVSSGRVKDYLILETLKKLNEDRKNQADQISEKVVSKIINL